MRVVIDIDEEYYDILKNSKEYIDEVGRVLQDCVLNGTPLPKGHGGLVDEKDLSLTTVHMIDGMFVCDAPTVIEADTEESEEQ